MWERGTKGPVVDDTHARQLPQLVRDKGQSAISSSLWEQEKTTFFPHACGWLTRRWTAWVVLDSHNTVSGPHCWPVTCWRTHAFPAECDQAPRLILLTGLRP